MAVKLGIHRVSYARIETGKVHPSKELFRNICESTGIKTPLPLECKSVEELETCSLCTQLNDGDLEIIKNKILMRLKNYKNIQPIIVALLLQIFSNLDYCREIFFN